MRQDAETRSTSDLHDLPWPCSCRFTILPLHPLAPARPGGEDGEVKEHSNPNSLKLSVFCHATL